MKPALQKRSSEGHQGGSDMQKTLARYLAVTAASLVLAFGLFGCAASPASSASSSTTSKSASASSGPTQDIDDNTTDKMYSDTKNNAELNVFQFGNDTITVDNYYPVDVMTGQPLRDGGFYKLVADVTYMNGGVAGYVNFPDIKRVHSCTEVSPMDLGLPSLPDKIYGLVLIGDYADGDILLNERKMKAVWKDGTWVYRYDDEINLPDGRHALVRRDAAEGDVLAGIENGVLSCEEYFVVPAQSN